MSHQHQWTEDGSLKHSCGCFRVLYYRCNCGAEDEKQLKCTCDGKVISQTQTRLWGRGGKHRKK